MSIIERLRQYTHLMRLHQPIGLLLLLWPTLWALWLAGHGKPMGSNVIIFILGAMLTRSAGCIINDMADINYDRHVERTNTRPLTSGRVSVKEALALLFLLAMSALLLVTRTNLLTFELAFVGAFLASIYPFMKRYTHLPQFFLGMTFAWSIPMAFAVELNAVPKAGWFVYVCVLLWAIIYDTLYAMVDREDDLKIGIKSSAILFGHHEKIIIAFLQLAFLSMLAGIGMIFALRSIYYLSIFAVASCCGYQQWLIKDRDRDQCFQAFLNNHWIGLIIFMGIYLGVS